MTLNEFLDKYVFVEWLWTALGFLAAAITFIVGMKSGNKISRADFVYRINSDFANNEHIQKVYAWLDKCRKNNENTNNYRKISGLFCSQEVDFIDLDTYANHFESVYVIRKVIRMKTIDKLFQQRFLLFMHNPFIQQYLLFHDYEANANLFSLLDKWMAMSYRRHCFNSMQFMDYLKLFTCGNFEYSYEKKTYNSLNWTDKLATNYRLYKNTKEYVPNICNPKCRYGYYLLHNKKKQQDLVVRIIRSDITDIDSIILLQNDIHRNMNCQTWYYPYSKKELQASINDENCIHLQVNIDERIIAFAVVIINPNEYYKLSNLVTVNNTNRKNEAVLETVFVDEEYRGYGIQSLLIDIMCHLASYRKATTMWASVHPNNIYSRRNFENNIFEKMNTDGPVVLYEDVRDIYCRNIKNIGMKDVSTGEIYYYPF